MCQASASAEPIRRGQFVGSLLQLKSVSRGQTPQHARRTTAERPGQQITPIERISTRTDFVSSPYWYRSDSYILEPHCTDKMLSVNVSSRRSVALQGTVSRVAQPKSLSKVLRCSWSSWLVQRVVFADFLERRFVQVAIAKKSVRTSVVSKVSTHPSNTCMFSPAIQLACALARRSGHKLIPPSSAPQTPRSSIDVYCMCNNVVMK